MLIITIFTKAQFFNFFYSFFIYKRDIRPRGGMVDTKDLKSLPFWECRFKSGRGYHL